VKKVLLLTAVFLFLCCKSQPEDALVTVDGSVLTRTEFEQYIPASQYRQLSDEQLTEFCDNWVNQEVLYLEAKKRGIHKEDSITVVIEEYTKNLLAMDLVRREFAGTGVTETEVRAYFEQHQDEFLYRVKVGQIVLPNMKAAQTTLAEIRAGADFFKLARERSLTRMEDPENPKVTTDYLQRGTIGDFGTEELIWSLDPGEVSEVIPYIQGTYLIVKMIDKRKTQARADYDTYSSAIYNYLLSQKYQNFLVQYVDSVKQQYKVSIDLSVLKD
jgi:peptidyl-prolyl cis-trans isomerase C